MRGRELLEKLKAAGYGCDSYNSGGSGFWKCYVTKAEVRKVVGNKNWTPQGMDEFRDGYLLFWVNAPRVRQ